MPRGIDVAAQMEHERVANYEIGHEYEDRLLEVVKLLGVEEVPHTAVGSSFDVPKITRCSLTQDLWQGFDFQFYIPKNGDREGVWIPFDFTIATKDADFIRKKQLKAEENGGAMLHIRKNVIDRALQGAEHDQKIVISAFSEMVNNFLAEKEEKEAKAKPSQAPQSPTTTIRPSTQPSSA